MYKIMLIDDDKDDRSIFTETLKSIDPTAQCVASKSGSDGLMALNIEKSLPDVVFLDINMPGMSGWEVLRKVKKDHSLKNIPVIMYSTSSHDRDVQIAADFGAVAFCTKPDDVKHLRTVLKFVLANIQTLTTLLFVESGINFFKQAKGTQNR